MYYGASHYVLRSFSLCIMKLLIMYYKFLIMYYEASHYVL